MILFPKAFTHLFIQQRSPRPLGSKAPAGGKQQEKYPRPGHSESRVWSCNRETPGSYGAERAADGSPESGKDVVLGLDVYIGVYQGEPEYEVHSRHSFIHLFYKPFYRALSC